MEIDDFTVRAIKKLTVTLAIIEVAKCALTQYANYNPGYKLAESALKRIAELESKPEL